MESPSKLPQIQQAWLWLLFTQQGFGMKWDFKVLNALAAKGLVIVHMSSYETTVDLTPAGRAEAARITAWRTAECDRLTAEEEAAKAQEATHEAR